MSKISWDISRQQLFAVNQADYNSFIYNFSLAMLREYLVHRWSFSSKKRKILVHVLVWNFFKQWRGFTRKCLVYLSHKIASFCLDCFIFQDMNRVLCNKMNLWVKVSWILEKTGCIEAVVTNITSVNIMNGSDNWNIM